MTFSLILLNSETSKNKKTISIISEHWIFLMYYLEHWLPSQKFRFNDPHSSQLVRILSYWNEPVDESTWKILLEHWVIEWTKEKNTCHHHAVHKWASSPLSTATDTVSNQGFPFHWEFAHGTCHQPHKGHLEHRRMQWLNEMQRSWMKIQEILKENHCNLDAIACRWIVEGPSESQVAWWRWQGCRVYLGSFILRCQWGIADVTLDVMHSPRVTASMTW